MKTFHTKAQCTGVSAGSVIYDENALRIHDKTTSSTLSTNLYFISPQIEGRAVNKGPIDNLEHDLIV